MIGQTFSHYRIVEQLGAGGMGVVFKAEDLRLKRLVALKFLPGELTRDPDAKERLIHEAQAASALDHPNICIIHEIDETPDGRLFVAMAYYEGETLRDRIARGPFTIDEAIGVALQVARAGGAAHDAGITHRDIKPANIMLTRRAEAKLVDFGIAKLAGQTRVTRTGTTVGTVAYMAPEQIEGAEADARSDVWAMGVVLFEMLTRRLPFDGTNEISLINAIANHRPHGVPEFRPDVPEPLGAIVARALTKDPAKRFSNAHELLRSLEGLQSRHEAVRSGATETVAVAVPSRRRNAVAIVASAVLLAGAVSAGWWIMTSRDIRAARDTTLPEIRQLIGQDKYVEAFATARRARTVLEDDPALETLWQDLSVVADVQTSPSGAVVSVRDVAQTTPYETLGETPLKAARIPRGVLRYRIEKAGFEPAEFIGGGPQTPVPAVVQLAKANELPAGMVRVPAGNLALWLTGYDYNKTIAAAEDPIDRFEVTNRQYKEFVDGGGYKTAASWKHPFVKDGRTLSWQDGVASFVDQTGRAGPSTWEVGTYPEGQDDYPVSGVSWYEAAAYAEFRGKSLPTVYHWLRAAGTTAAASITPFSNFTKSGPIAVGRSAGVGPFGLSDAAGNVKEWCANELSPGGERYLLGGAWNDPDYMFLYADARLPFDRPATAGFRAAKYLKAESAPATTAAAIPRLVRNYAAEKPASDDAFRAYRTLYAYDPAPLDPKTESVDESSASWRREKVSFNAAYGKDRVPAYLFLPKQGQQPYPLVVYWPGSSVIRQRSIDELATELFDFMVLSGRAVLVPVYYGTFERNDGRMDSWPEATRAYREWVIKQIADARRALDYAEARPELSRTNVGYAGFSWGGRMGSIVLALEPRFKAAVFVSGGLSPGQAPPEVDPFTFAPRVSVPVLMVNGDSDYIFEVERSQKPLYGTLGSAVDRKQHIVFPGGHAIAFEKRQQVVREILDWLDRYLRSPE